VINPGKEPDGATKAANSSQEATELHGRLLNALKSGDHQEAIAVMGLLKVVYLDLWESEGSMASGSASSAAFGVSPI